MHPIVHGGVGSPQSIYQVSTNPHHRIGTRGYANDGRIFYYGRNTTSGAIDRGKLCARPELVPNHENMATDESLVAVGSNVLPAGAVTPGATAVAANAYAEGYLVVTDAGSEGLIYKVRSNTAFTSATADGEIVLYDDIAIAFDANTTVSLIKNAYDSPQLSPVDQQDVLVGVPTFTLPIGNVTTQYGWFQTWGECAIWSDEAVATVGQAIVTGTGTAGQVEEDDTATTVSQEPLVGYNVTPLVESEYQVV